MCDLITLASTRMPFQPVHPFITILNGVLQRRHRIENERQRSDRIELN